jgi:hypothetical protein
MTFTKLFCKYLKFLTYYVILLFVTILYLTGYLIWEPVTWDFLRNTSKLYFCNMLNNSYMANCTKDIEALLEMDSKILLCTVIHWLYRVKFVIYPFGSQDELWNLLLIPIYSSHIALRLAKWVHIFGKFSQLNRLILNFMGRHKWVHQKNRKMLWSMNFVCLLGDSVIPTTHYCLVFQIYHVKCSYQTKLMWLKLTVKILISTASWVLYHFLVKIQLD